MTTTPTNNEESDRIVVGIDGSEHSLGALAWAARQAALTSTPLTVITTWEFPTSYGYAVGWPADIDFAADAKSVLDGAVAKVIGPNPDIKITASVIQGHPSLVLVDESKSASLVVVGCRGHGEFAGMLLGSVSEFLATHAHCPIAIFRGEDEKAPSP